VTDYIKELSTSEKWFFWSRAKLLFQGRGHCHTSRSKYFCQYLWQSYYGKSLDYLISLIKPY